MSGLAFLDKSEEAMLISTILILVGLSLLVGGANVMIRGATAVASALSVPPVVIGLTIVGFGTSAPELVVNSTAAFSGEPTLAFGNLVGSCIMNLGWVLAITALAKPINVERSIISREIPMMLLATASFSVLAADRWLNSASHDLVGRGDGVMLLLVFAVFVYYTVASVLSLPKKAQEADPYVVEVTDRVERRRTLSKALSLLMTFGGLAALVAGGRLTVFAAVKIAHALGMPEFLIGLTIISFGTTLPELVTGVLAARRGEGDLAMGNVVGSNIFNLLFIGGVVSMVHPIPVPAGGLWDMMVLLVLSALVLPVAIRGPRIVTRAEATLLLTIYLSYVVVRVWKST